MENVEKEFQQLLSYCKKQKFTKAELEEICQPLIWRQRLNWIRKWIIPIILSLFISILVYFYCIDWLSWFFSALGRLALIELLPYWDWVPLYKTKCLIERPVQQDVSDTIIPGLGKYQTEPDNCVLCEALERVPTMNNVTFSFIESNFLERGYPVIVTDSHSPQTLDSLLNIMLIKASNFLDSKPCDLAENLMLKKLFTIGQCLQKIKAMSVSEKWFLQLRNCQSKAVKASRAFIRRPYYHPVHLEPFYSSWILMSNNYAHSEELYLQGLVIVQQLAGMMDIRLRPKRPCDGICPAATMRLTAGEALIFPTDLWVFSYAYLPTETKLASIATILEIEWSF